MLFEGEAGSGWLDTADVGRVKTQDERKVDRSIYAIRQNLSTFNKSIEK